MSWIKDGSTVRVDYLDYIVDGIVLESRVKYGGKVQYTVELSEPVQFRWRTEPTTRVLVDADDIVQDFGILDCPVA